MRDQKQITGGPWNMQDAEGQLWDDAAPGSVEEGETSTKLKKRCTLFLQPVETPSCLSGLCEVSEFGPRPLDGLRPPKI